MATVLEYLITGGAVFAIPDSKLELLWIGPGSDRLHIGSPRKPGGLTTTVTHPAADLTSSTMRGAKEAVDRLVAAFEASA